MKFDNSRDSKQYGYDAGYVVDGIVSINAETGEFILIDEDGVGFSSQEVLKSLIGKKVRITMISHESMEEIQKLMIPSGPKN